MKNSKEKYIKLGTANLEKIFTQANSIDLSKKDLKDNFIEDVNNGKITGVFENQENLIKFITVLAKLEIPVRKISAIANNADIEDSIFYKVVRETARSEDAESLDILLRINSYLEKPKDIDNDLIKIILDECKDSITDKKLDILLAASYGFNDKNNFDLMLSFSRLVNIIEHDKVEILLPVFLKHHEKCWEIYIDNRNKAIDEYRLTHKGALNPKEYSKLGSNYLLDITRLIEAAPNAKYVRIILEHIRGIEKLGEKNGIKLLNMEKLLQYSHVYTAVTKDINSYIDTLEILLNEAKKAGLNIHDIITKDCVGGMIDNVLKAGGSIIPLIALGKEFEIPVQEILEGKGNSIFIEVAKYGMKALGQFMLDIEMLNEDLSINKSFRENAIKIINEYLGSIYYNEEILNFFLTKLNEKGISDFELFIGKDAKVTLENIKPDSYNPAAINLALEIADKKGLIVNLLKVIFSASSNNDYTFCPKVIVSLIKYAAKNKMLDGLFSLNNGDMLLNSVINSKEVTNLLVEVIKENLNILKKDTVDTFIGAISVYKLVEAAIDSNAHNIIPNLLMISKAFPNKGPIAQYFTDYPGLGETLIESIIKNVKYLEVKEFQYILGEFFQYLPKNLFSKEKFNDIVDSMLRSSDRSDILQVFLDYADKHGFPLESVQLNSNIFESGNLNPLMRGVLIKIIEAKGLSLEDIIKKQPELLSSFLEHYITLEHIKALLESCKDHSPSFMMAAKVVEKIKLESVSKLRDIKENELKNLEVKIKDLVDIVVNNDLLNQALQSKQDVGYKLLANLISTNKKSILLNNIKEQLKKAGFDIEERFPSIKEKIADDSESLGYLEKNGIKVINELIIKNPRFIYLDEKLSNQIQHYYQTEGVEIGDLLRFYINSGDIIEDVRVEYNQPVESKPEEGKNNDEINLNISIIKPLTIDPAQQQVNFHNLTINAVPNNEQLGMNNNNNNNDEGIIANLLNHIMFTNFHSSEF